MKKIDINNVLELVFDKNPSPIWIYDTKTLKFLKVNHSACLMYGFSEKEFLSKKISQILHNYKKDVLNHRNENAEYTSNVVHNLSGGTKKKVFVKGYNTNNDGREITIEFIDLKDPHKINKKEQTELSDYFEKLCSSMNDYVLIVNSQSYSIIKCIHISGIIFGYSAEELLNKKLDVLFGKEVFSNLMNDLDSLIDNNSQIKNEFIIKNKDGSTVSVDCKISEVLGRSKNRIALLFVLQDVTRIQKAEKNFYESEKKYHTLIEQISNGVIIATKKGSLVIANTKVCEMLGIEENDIINFNLNDFDIKTNEIKNEHNNSNSSNGFLKTKRLVARKDGLRLPVEISVKRLDEQYDIWTITDITKQEIAEKERERLFRKLSDSQDRMRTLSRRLIEVQENERGIIARELHDEIGQILTAVKIDIQSAYTFTKSNKIKNQLNSCVELVEHALSDIRNLSLNLRPSILDDLGLIPALRWYLDKQAQRAGIKAKFKTDNIRNKLIPELEITCYRIIQEALNNVIKHSNAKNVNIELWIENKNLHMQITDDGKGFDVNMAKMNAIEGLSIGILGIQERAELVGGWLDIYSSPGAGTKIYAIFPLSIKTL